MLLYKYYLYTSSSKPSNWPNTLLYFNDYINTKKKKKKKKKKKNKKKKKKGVKKK